MKTDIWMGFTRIIDEFQGHELILVKPNCAANGHWALKTEYFVDFPDVQIRLLEQGYHIAHVKNTTRWTLPSDTERQAALASYLHEKYGLAEKFAVIGMSCGGMQGIYLGAKHPEVVSCLYLDAPVVNLLSCPGKVGRGGPTEKGMEEFVNAMGMTFKDLLASREHPLDYIPQLVKNKIPVCLVCGDSDSVVPYDENGVYLYNAYKEAGNVIEQYIKEGCDHHPHSLPDNQPIIDFILNYDK